MQNMPVMADYEPEFAEINLRQQPQVTRPLLLQLLQQDCPDDVARTMAVQERTRPSQHPSSQLATTASELKSLGGFSGEDIEAAETAPNFDASRLLSQKSGFLSNLVPSHFNPPPELVSLRAEAQKHDDYSMDLSPGSNCSYPLGTGTFSKPSSLPNTKSQVGFGDDLVQSSSWGKSPPEEYQMRLRLLKEQKKKRLTMAQQEQGRIMSPEKKLSPEEYQMRLRLLEEQNKKRLTMAQEEQQIRLRLLEEQNKKRLMMTRQEQDNR